MDVLVVGLLVGTMAANLAALGLQRITRIIGVVALQGIATALLLFLVHQEEVSARLVGLVATMMLLKGYAIPRLLLRSIREAQIVDVTNPFVGCKPSTALGLLLTGLAFLLGWLLELPHPPASGLIVPAALAAVFAGMQVLVTRRKAISQVLGYLMLENGVLLFGLVLAPGLPVVVEMGVLLDLFVAVFVMGITIFHINREFDHIDASRLHALHDDRSRRRWPFGLHPRTDDGGER